MSDYEKRRKSHKKTWNTAFCLGNVKLGIISIEVLRKDCNGFLTEERIPSGFPVFSGFKWNNIGFTSVFLAWSLQILPNKASNTDFLVVHFKKSTFPVNRDNLYFSNETVFSL